MSIHDDIDEELYEAKATIDAQAREIAELREQLAAKEKRIAIYREAVGGALKTANQAIDLLKQALAQKGGTDGN